jgi:DHA2 family multidrug resistance protein
VIDVGYLLAPRGVGTMLGMFVVGKLSGRADPRGLILFGLSLTVLSLWEMTYFNTDITSWTIARNGILQGLGLGLVFVPLTTISFATLPRHYRDEGTSLFTLLRNIGSSIGISVVITELAQNTQTNHAAFADYITPFSLPLRQAVEAGVYSLDTAQGLMAINGEVTRQAATLAYLQDFRLMMWVTLCAVPLILLLRSPRKQPTPVDVHEAME